MGVSYMTKADIPKLREALEQRRLRGNNAVCLLRGIKGWFKFSLTVGSRPLPKAAFALFPGRLPSCSTSR